MWYDENGKQYKSSVEVQRVLNEKTAFVANPAMEESSNESSDDNKAAADTSEGEPSPAKRPHQDSKYAKTCYIRHYKITHHTILSMHAVTLNKLSYQMLSTLASCHKYNHYSTKSVLCELTKRHTAKVSTMQLSLY